jgi:hypothetical protein
MSTQPPLPPTPYTVAPSSAQTVVITDINMSIGAMCRFLVKFVIAAIPAALILWVLMIVAGIIVATVFGGIIHGLLHAPDIHI